MTPLILMLAVLAAPDTSQLKRYEATQPHMGSLIQITVYAANEELATKGIEAAFGKFAAYNEIMSDYLAESELNRLSKSSPTTSPLRVSKPLFNVLTESQHWSQQTGGAFDISIGPVVRLWRRARRRKEFPDETRLKSAKESVGWRHIELNANNRTVALKHANMRLDLGGIAKGFAADAALKTLRELGINRAQINASGDIVAGDPPPGKKGWTIEVAPLEPNGKPSRKLLIANAAVATSGDAFQFIEIEGKRYSHIIDPRTGTPVTGRSSVTIIAKTGSDADAAASAVSVLGREAGMKFVEGRNDLQAIIVTLQDGTARARVSGGLSAYLFTTNE